MLSLDEVAKDPQAQAIGLFPTIESEVVGSYHSVRIPMRMPRAKIGPKGPALRRRHMLHRIGARGARAQRFRYRSLGRRRHRERRGRMKSMKLGLQLGYWGTNPPQNLIETVKTAEGLGYDSVWTAEAYGSDALTPLAWVGAHTSKIRLGTAVCQLSARTPTAMAMAALTLDHLSQGRFMLGLGVSGPQVVEGWYGRPFAKPLARTREYVSIIKKVLAGRARHQRRRTLPSPTRGRSLGPRQALKPITHPLRPDVPIFIGAEGPENVAQRRRSPTVGCPSTTPPSATRCTATPSSRPAPISKWPRASW